MHRWDISVLLESTIIVQCLIPFFHEMQLIQVYFQHFCWNEESCYLLLCVAYVKMLHRLTGSDLRKERKEII